MVLCKKIGLLPDNWDAAFSNISKSDFTGGSYQDFINNIADPVNELGNLKPND
jgi:hypothetical protein